MNNHHPPNNIIERKLEQLTPVDTDHLWNDMHARLDATMPQKKERRRFIAWWLLSARGLLLLTAAVLTVTGSSLLFLSTKESSTATIKELRHTPASDKVTEDGTAGISKEVKENIATGTEPVQKNSDDLSGTASLASAVGRAINNSLVTLGTINESKKIPTKDQFKAPIQGSEKYIAKEQFDRPIEAISKAIAYVDIEAMTMNLIPKDPLIVTNHIEEKNSLNLQSKAVAGKVKTNTANNNDSRFYAGIVSGVDLSSIHFKSLRTGATKGFIIGYAFNEKWSIESGLLWDTKRVYDNGKYFDPPGYTPTSGITITTVNGKSRLYELPVNMRYTIISGKNKLFATTGISSYLMRSENYDYEYLQNNQPGGHNYLSYKNETQNWFSVVNFSVGYTHKLGDIGSVRVEPYVKLPLNNLGVGNMPVMSTGLNIGFTKPLRR